MTRALVAIFKSWSMAEIDKRSLSPEEAATALLDLAIHYGAKVGKDRAALAAMLDDRSAALAVEGHSQEPRR